MTGKANKNTAAWQVSQIANWNPEKSAVPAQDDYGQSPTPMFCAMAPALLMHPAVASPTPPSDSKS